MVCLSSSGDTTMGLTASRTQASHCVFGILLLLDRISLRYLERTSQYNISVSGRHWPHTTLRTDFLDDSCSSPAIINSSRICAVNGLANVMQQRLGTFRTEYAFWKLKILRERAFRSRPCVHLYDHTYKSSSHTCSDCQHASKATPRHTGRTFPK